MNVTERRVYAPEELEASLAPILDVIRSAFHPERVILFGSAAEGREWHDLDLLVVAETDGRYFDRQRKLTTALAEVSHVPADIFIYTPDELQQQIRENRFFIVREVLGKGRTVYPHAGASITKRSSRAFSAASGALGQGVQPMTEEMVSDTESWLQLALEDRRWADHSLEGNFYPQACFASQQSVEKLLKAYLLSKDRVPPRIHALPALLALCSDIDPRLAGLEAAASLLDRYYIATRYPDVSLPGGPYGEKEARQAFEAADSVFEALEQPIREWLSERQ